MAANKVQKKTLTGVVVSDAMDKTVVVSVSTLKTHAKYNKKYQSTKKYKAHDENNTCKVGDTVTIEESKPVSKDKSFVVVA